MTADVLAELAGRVERLLLDERDARAFLSERSAIASQLRRMARDQSERFDRHGR